MSRADGSVMERSIWSSYSGSMLLSIPKDMAKQMGIKPGHKAIFTKPNMVRKTVKIDFRRSTHE